MAFLRTRLVTEPGFWKAKAELGTVYFVRDAEADAIKVGYSKDHLNRISTLQVGSARKLELIGLIAAPPEVETIVHSQLYEGRMHGEWFYDRGVTTQWLMDMTQGEPLYRNIWDIVQGRNWLGTPDGVKHIWDPDRKEWIPPL